MVFEPPIVESLFLTFIYYFDKMDLEKDFRPSGLYTTASGEFFSYYFSGKIDMSHLRFPLLFLLICTKKASFPEVIPANL